MNGEFASPISPSDPPHDYSHHNSFTANETSNDSSSKTFFLPKSVEFGFHKVCSEQVTVTENCLKAEKKDPSLHYAHGVTYGAKPLKGTAEFEVTLADYGTGWSGTLKLGVARYKAGHSFQVNNIPRYSPEAPNHCVWSSDKVHNRLQTNQNVLERQYGFRNLDSLREGDRLGLRLTHNGSLVFFVNGMDQGVAAENVYEKGHEVYAVVDHYANCKSTIITRAGRCVYAQIKLRIPSRHPHSVQTNRIICSLYNLPLMSTVQSAFNVHMPVYIHAFNFHMHV